MMDKKITIISYCLMGFLIIIGVGIGIDTYYINSQISKLSFPVNNIEKKPSGKKMISGSKTREEKKKVVQEIAASLEEMTAEQAYDWFQDILSRDMLNWANPSNKMLDDSANHGEDLMDELRRLSCFDDTGIEDMMRRMEDPDYRYRDIIAAGHKPPADANELHGYLSDLDMSSFDKSVRRQIADFNEKLDYLLDKTKHENEITYEDSKLAYNLYRQFNEVISSELVRQSCGDVCYRVGQMTEQFRIYYGYHPRGSIPITYLPGTFAAFPLYYPLNPPERN